MELQKLIDGLKAHKSGAASYESVDEAIRVFEAMLDVDGEKVLFGLECLEDGKTDEECKRCPYQPYRFGHCKYDVMRDALTLIRQQQERIKELEAGQTARVMSLEEWENAHEPLDGECMCYEIKNEGLEAMLVKAFNGCKELYGKNFRCWTSKPTVKQRKATPWND